jgi:hypothetical protein
MAPTNGFDEFLDTLADHLAAQVVSRLKLGAPGGSKTAKATKRRTGRKLEMGCRVEGCTNQSRGPRFGFICNEHRRTLKKSEHAAARAAWNAKKKRA